MRYRCITELWIMNEILQPESLLSHYGATGFFLFAFCFICPELEIMSKILVYSNASNNQNSHRFVKDCFGIRRIVKIFIIMSQTKWPLAAN